jgi:thiamine kinase-like enzyme
VHAADIARVDVVFDGVAVAAAAPRRIEALPGGLTNRNYRVFGADGSQAVARVACDQGELLGIDRNAEHANSCAAAEAGVAPAVLAFDPDQRVLAVDWIEGRTFDAVDLDDSETLARVARTCAQLHAGPRFINDFDMFAVQRGYLELVSEKGFRLPARYAEFSDQVTLMQRALTVRDEGTRPCHNDLLAANIMDDGERIWFIDFEYSGNNDVCFELGNLWSESNLSEDRLVELVTEYFGGFYAAKLARARLFALMSKYGWTLWASIQAAVSEVDFDFWSWGMEKFDRAVAEFDSPQFTQWISDVQQPHQPREQLCQKVSL